MRGLLLDANLLVLLLVGLKDPGLVGHHKRTREYTPEDYELLRRMLSSFDRLLLTTSVLTECSNLIRYVDEPLRSELTTLLGEFLKSAEEQAVPSADAVGDSAFPRLGLTDAGLLQCVGVESPLLTVDLDLYLAAMHRAPGAATNFNHYR